MDQKRKNRASNALKTLTRSIANFYLRPDEFFYRIGLSIGNKPWLWLLASLGISCICGPGMLLWREEIDDVELYIPQNSIVRSDSLWVKEHFRDDLRYESIIITAPNVLEPEVLQKIAEIENEVKSIVVNNTTWQDVCAGYLTWFENNDEESNSTKDEDMETLNKMMEMLNNTIDDDCIYQSLLRLWKNEDIKNLTRERIFDDVTQAINGTDSLNNFLTDVGPLLSRIKYDSMGRVIGAEATILNFITKKSNENLPDWELKFIERISSSKDSLRNGTKIYGVASRSFKDFLHQVLESNMAILFCGLSLIAIYVMVMIGRCNVVQQRIYLSIMGVSVVGQAILSAYGVSYYLGYFYGPLHSVLPFLLLGIGVDDMFVVIQSLENLPKSERSDGDRGIPKRIAEALRHSGMSITVTSITNVVAFAIGVTTVIPFLKSFCVFACLGIFFLYLFEITFFVGCLVLDERRLVLNKDGCLCRRKSNWIPNDCSQRDTQRVIFEKFVGPLVMKKSSKIGVLLVTIFLVSVNIWAIFQLDQNFDPLWYLNQESDPIKFNDKLVEYFPKYGKRAAVYLSGVDYHKDAEDLQTLVSTLKSSPYINNNTLDPWFVAFDNYLKEGNCDNDYEYYECLTHYMLTREGRSYIQDIKFDKLPFGDYNITTSKMQFQHVPMKTLSDQIRAMRSIRDVVRKANLSRTANRVTVFSQEYVFWAASEIIGDELIHNLCLEIVAVGFVTLLILRNVKASVWVICCVLFTLIDLLGSMYFLGLTIEVSSSVMVLLCAGLSVDYAAHVGLEFTHAKGTKNERAISTLGLIGPAVFNGGLSTFLAFVLLGASDAYLFTTFFKLFTCVVVFGLFHGLIFLPVVLSLFGPGERARETESSQEIDEKIDNSNKDQNGFTTVHLGSSCPDLVVKTTVKN